MNAPVFDQHAQFFHRVEDFTVQELVPQFRVEAFAVAVFPRAPWFDVSRFGSRAGEPLAQIPGHELGAVVGAKMLRHTFGHHHVGQRFDDLR
jgi:hypothetical protein